MEAKSIDGINATLSSNALRLQLLNSFITVHFPRCVIMRWTLWLLNEYVALNYATFQLLYRWMHPAASGNSCTM